MIRRFWNNLSHPAISSPQEVSNRFPKHTRIPDSSQADEEPSSFTRDSTPTRDAPLDTIFKKVHIRNPSRSNHEEDSLFHSIDDNGISSFTDCYTWGTSLHGELGRIQSQSLISENTARIVPGLQALNIIHVALGDRRSLALTHDGVVYAWGRCFGKSIDDNERYRPKMFLWSDIVQVPRILFKGDVPVEEIFCGYTHAMWVCRGRKTLYSIGSNKHGQLGIGSEVSSSEPKQVQFEIMSPESPFKTTVSRIVDIALGQFHSVAIVEFTIREGGSLREERKVLSWGRGSKGAHGQGVQADVRKPQLIPFFEESKISQDVRLISCGNAHSSFILENDDIYVCGSFSTNGSVHLQAPQKISLHDSLYRADLGIHRFSSVKCSTKQIVLLTSIQAL